MELRLFKTLWGHESGIGEACAAARDAGFTGLEGPAPQDAVARREWRAALDDYGLDFIAEITTAGSYVPDRAAGLDEHLVSLAQKLDASAALGAGRVTCLGGCDAWPDALSQEFFERAMAAAAARGLAVSFETHRGRSLFNPWVTDRLCQALPNLRLTADFSHWCVVTESLLQDQAELMARVLLRVDHIHARVGYDQGPQVSNPAAAHHEAALYAHEAWWVESWRLQRAAGRQAVTMTPEFGPDGYQALDADSGEPVGDLWTYNRWMAERQRDRFDDFLRESASDDYKQVKQA